MLGFEGHHILVLINVLLISIFNILLHRAWVLPVIISRSDLLFIRYLIFFFCRFVLILLITLLNCRVARIRLIFRCILRRTKERLFHAEGIVKRVILILLVYVLTWNFVKNLRVKKYLIGSLRKKNMLLVVLMLKEKAAAVTAWCLVLYCLLHLNESLLACSVVDNHRTACISVVHAKFVCKIFRSSLT